MALTLVMKEKHWLNCNVCHKHDELFTCHLQFGWKVKILSRWQKVRNLIPHVSLHTAFREASDLHKQKVVDHISFHQAIGTQKPT
jgi:hypothetical protein